MIITSSNRNEGVSLGSRDVKRQFFPPPPSHPRKLHCLPDIPLNTTLFVLSDKFGVNILQTRIILIYVHALKITFRSLNVLTNKPYTRII